MNWEQHQYPTELDFTEYIQYIDVRIFAGPPIYHLPGNIISATVGFEYINRQHMCFLAPLISDNYRSLEKFELETLSSPDTSKEKFLHGL